MNSRIKRPVPSQLVPFTAPDAEGDGHRRSVFLYPKNLAHLKELQETVKTSSTNELFRAALAFAVANKEAFAMAQKKYDSSY